MRKIDTEAYNKRLHTEIMELDKMIKSINPENINQFDAGLIKTADTYIKLISDTTWADNSNFNGIEMHKVKDMMNKIKSKKNDKYFAARYVWHTPIFSRIADGRIFGVSIDVPENFEGRKSFVSTSVLLYNATSGLSHLKMDRRGRRMTEDGGFYTVFKHATKIDVNINIYTDKGYDAWLDIFVLYWK